MGLFRGRKKDRLETLRVPRAPRLMAACSLALVLFGTGCGVFTLTGYVIGASTDRLQTVPPRTYPTPDQCDDIRVRGEDSHGRPRVGDGELLASTPREATIEFDDGRVVTTQWANFTKVSCVETYAGMGTLVGLGVDAIATTILIVELHDALKNVSVQ